MRVQVKRGRETQVRVVSKKSPGTREGVDRLDNTREEAPEQYTNIAKPNSLKTHYVQ